MVTYKWINENDKIFEEAREIKSNVDYNNLSLRLDEINSKIEHWTNKKTALLNYISEVKTALKIP